MIEPGDKVRILKGLRKGQEVIVDRVDEQDLVILAGSPTERFQPDNLQLIEKKS